MFIISIGATVSVLLIALGLIGLYRMTVPVARRLPATTATSIDDGIRTIPQAVARLRISRRIGFDLVAEAQNLVARKMANSRRNNWDSPARAFIRGLGNSQQKALALQAILKGLGIEAEPMAALCRLPKARIHEHCEGERSAFHVWLRVSVGGVVKDVCPADVANRPGINNFGMLSPRHRYGKFAQIGRYLDIVVANVREDNAAELRAAERAAEGIPQRLFDHASVKVATPPPPRQVKPEPKLGRPQMPSRAWLTGEA